MKLLCEDCNKNKAGIYKITCLITGKFYIGRTSNFNQRLQQHKHSFHTIRAGKIVEHAKMYGIDNLEMCIIEILANDKILVTIQANNRQFIKVGRIVL